MGGVISFAKAKEMLTKRATKKLGNNTYLESNNDGSFGIMFHRTEIVRIFEDGSFEIDNGGYTTPTTKQRIEEFSSVRIEQKKYVWYVHTLTGLYEFERDMRFTPNHEPVNKTFRKISNESWLTRRAASGY
jgi:hypothetical protein